MKKLFKNINKKIILSFLLWLLSISVFDILFFIRGDLFLFTNFEVIFLVITIIMGSISFLIFIFSLGSIFYKKFSLIKALFFYFISFCFFIFLGFLVFVLPFGSVGNYYKKEVSIPPVKASKNTLITAGLKLGSSGEEVKVLQSALATDKSIYPSGLISGYYGELTKQAVINFQQKYSLSQTGEIDRQTADKFNEVYGDKTRKFYLSLFPTPIKNLEIIKNISYQNTDNEEWGVAKQISEKTWRIKVGEDKKMATSQEIFEALNVYRQRHGKNALNWDDRLASYALLRAKYFTQIGGLDEHKGFEEYVKDINNLKTLGFWLVGENASFGYKLEGVHLIEWVFAGDEPHNTNQLNPQWSHVGIGVDGYNVDIIFGAYPM